MIISFESSNHQNLVVALLNLTRIADPTIASTVSGDVFRRLLVYLNRPEFQNGVHTNSKAITDALTALLTQVRADNSQITAYIQAQ
jgi:hypothetical protein